MSAPVPLNSGCCAPTCPDNPQTAVPGPAGENAFSFTSLPFTQPAVGSPVLLTLTHDGWVAPGQTIFVQGGGYYQVVTVTGTNVLVNNLGTTGNAAPGFVVALGAQVSPGGVGGNTGNAYTTVSTPGFTQPAVSANVVVPVVSSAWASVGQTVFVSTGGSYTVFAIPDGTHLTLTNLGYPGNAAPATVITAPQTVSPAGPQGPAGSAGSVTLNSISPTTTKGDLIVDNGANSPLASDVRIGVGTNGQLLSANSAQPTGVQWNTVTPNTAATAGDIAVFSNTTGNPIAVQDSKLLITTDGAIQSTPTGGNARGTKAVDLQVQRALNTQVASGLESVVIGGANNTASGSESGVVCGDTNSAANTQAFVGGGASNNASGSQAAICAGFQNAAAGNGAFVGGGANNSASANDSVVCGGFGNVASGVDSSILGGINNQTTVQGATVGGGANNNSTATYSTCPGGFQANAYLYGQVSHSAGAFATFGDSQTSELLYRIQTSDATAGVEAFLDGTSLRAVVPLNTTWAFVLRTVARSSAGVCAVWETKGGIQNNAGTVTLIAANTQAVIVDGTGGTWGVTGNLAVTADNTNKSLKVAVTGAALTNIRWVTHARLVEVSF